MLARQLGNFFVPANGGAYALVLVSRNGHTVGTAANQYAPGRFTTLYRQGRWVGKIGVIYRFVAVGSFVYYFQAFAFQQVDNNGFECKAGMVGTYGNRLLRRECAF